MELNMYTRFVVVLCVVMARFSYAARNEFDVVKHLNRLNKPPVKSIKSPDGDIIDCVLISHQTAFDHPSLKNHTIQMRPNVHPEGMHYENMKDSSQTRETITQLWQLNGKCPKGTIPIRRTTKEDILRASSMKNYGKKSSLSTVAHPNSIDLDLINDSGHEHAIAFVEGEFYGAKASMNVWNPQIQQTNEFSLSQIWLLGGSFASDLNSIEAGWQVSPDLYGDHNTRFFTYWTSDAYQSTGCYNLLCSGFIQINNEIALGASISPMSKYQGSQYDISLLVWKDPEQGNWWMQFGHGNVLGYWPGSLFSYLTTSASMIQWGGEVVNSADDGQHTTTQMGSGHFPEEGFGKSSYFRNVQIVDGSNSLRNPKHIGTFTEQPNCYDVQTGKSKDWGNYIYYGGPGRNPNCP
ncbi:putative neprosin [Helianthus debilis subsp. tardiflorus]